MSVILRFAPSPNGALHLGHAFSALLNFELAKRMDGRFLLRIEDIDLARCTDGRINQMLDDMRWLGLEWEDEVLKQSSRFDAYQQKLDELKEKGWLYPSHASRTDIKKAVVIANQNASEPWSSDPDGAPLYPRHLLGEKEDPNQQNQAPPAWRLDMTAILNQHPKLKEQVWRELGPHPDGETILNQQMAMDAARWGDVILARKDCPTSYHLSVTLDDALQGITHIVRGQDLFWATGLHRLLQVLFDLPEPTYFHHGLINDDQGQKLSKSKQDISLKALREQGYSAADIRKASGIDDIDLDKLAASLLS